MGIPMSKMRAHNTASDFGVVFHNQVYDLTNYAERHPGKSTDITNLAGMEGTRAFDVIHLIAHLAMMWLVNLFRNQNRWLLLHHHLVTLPPRFIQYPLLPPRPSLSIKDTPLSPPPATPSMKPEQAPRPAPKRSKQAFNTPSKTNILYHAGVLQLMKREYLSGQLGTKALSIVFFSHEDHR